MACRRMATLGVPDLPLAACAKGVPRPFNRASSSLASRASASAWEPAPAPATRPSTVRTRSVNALTEVARVLQAWDGGCDAMETEGGWHGSQVEGRAAGKHTHGGPAWGPNATARVWGSPHPGPWGYQTCGGSTSSQPTYPCSSACCNLMRPLMSRMAPATVFTKAPYRRDFRIGVLHLGHCVGKGDGDSGPVG
jgi:hypothetical protein